MNAQKRSQIMQILKLAALEADRRGDVTAREQAARTWRELATAAQLARAPKVLK